MYVYAVVCFFAVFGFIQMLICIKDFFFTTDASNFTVVVTVKNQQDTVEGTIRAVVWNCLHKLGGKTIPQIIAVDLGSEDDTYEILKELSRQYDFITVTNKDGYIKLMEQGNSLHEGRG